MPTYDFLCAGCAARTQEVRSINDTSEFDLECFTCGGKLVRVYSFALTFNGEGFYVNDKRKKAGE